MRVRTCALCCVVAASSWATSAHADVAGTVVQVGASSTATQSASAISGNGMVWTNTDANGWQIWYADVSATPPKALAMSNANELDSLADIDMSSGQPVVVWMKYNTVVDGTDIYIDDTSVTPTSLRAIAPASQTTSFGSPAISPDYIVYERVSSGQRQIDGYWRGHGAFAQLVTSDAALHYNPRVSGDFVVYTSCADSSCANSSVGGYHILKGVNFTIASGGAYDPDVDGTKVVYVSGAQGLGQNQIQLYDDATGVTTPITSVASNKAWARISGTHIVWSDDRNGAGYDIYSYDLSTNKEDRLAGGAGDQAHPAIDGNRVTFTSPDANGNLAVYAFTYAAAKPVLVGNCDPASTDLLDGPYGLAYNGRPISVTHQFTGKSSYSYYSVCIDNGYPDGTLRPTNGTVTVEGTAVVGKDDFALDASGNPPAQIAKGFNATVATHKWVQSLPMQSSSAYFSVSIRGVLATSTTSTSK